MLCHMCETEVDAWYMIRFVHSILNREGHEGEERKISVGVNPKLSTVAPIYSVNLK